MSNLSIGGFLIGLAAIAGVLYLLQRLRVRYREHVVVTTLFWKQAVEEARARVLVRRFKHLFAYLFVLLIAALLWLGFADPQRGDTGGAQHIVLLDGSAGMGRGDHFAKTINWGPYVDEIWHEIPCPGWSCDPNVGTAIPITAGTTVTGTDFTLDPVGGNISGTVVDGATGAPIPWDCMISVAAADGTWMTGGCTDHVFLPPALSPLASTS